MNTLLMMVKKWSAAKTGLVVLFFILFALALFMEGCKNDDPNIPPGTGEPAVEVTFSGIANGRQFNLTDSFALDSQGFNYKFDLFKFYISQMVLVKTDNSEVLIKDIDLIDFRTDAPHLSFTATIPEGDYKAVRFGIGVDSTDNKKLPSSFDASHPLSSGKGMYWDMGSMYRFMIVEGYLDTVGGTIPEYTVPFVVHTGMNPLYREKTFTKGLNVKKADREKLEFVIQVDSVLSNINFRYDHFTHTMGSGMDLAVKFSDNMINNITLK